MKQHSVPMKHCPGAQSAPDAVGQCSCPWPSDESGCYWICWATQDNQIFWHQTYSSKDLRLSMELLFTNGGGRWYPYHIECGGNDTACSALWCYKLQHFQLWGNFSVLQATAWLHLQFKCGDAQKKKCKNRFTALLCYDADGAEKLTPPVIGKFA